ncbi:beta-ketoacyl synthase N-terminal-like domain-containing protein [Escherichia coli]|uniref:beta-ketoacyl synthase N-terminal-like domain-containing protein n=1 Tax=Escherichia coli TaxID=562 RepID=UPI0032ED8546
MVQHYPDCEPVAVIGYACHFPESPDGETFWQNLLEGRECSRRFTREELLAVVWMPPSLTILIMSISVRC